MARPGQLYCRHRRVPAVSITGHDSPSLDCELTSLLRLRNLTLDPGTGRNPRKGGQNYTHCCLLAVNASLDIKDGFIIETPSSFIQTTVEDLLAATEANQFPCAAKWDGNRAGAPVVQVPYSWLETTCPGWQLSRSKPESQWISPFVGFLLPAVVFCKSAPPFLIVRRFFQMY